MRKPYLLIDVDGVLNPYWAENCPQGYAEHQIAGYRVRLNPKHGQWLNELGEHYELVWATAWQDKANEFLSPLLGLPELPYIDFSEAEFELKRMNVHDILEQEVLTWKLPAVQNFVKDRAFLWFDDDIQRDALNWAKDRDAPSSIVRIRPSIGLAKQDIKSALRFARGLEDKHSSIS